MQQLGSTTKKKPQVYHTDNIVESLRSVGSAVTTTVTKDIIGKTATDVITSLVGGPIAQSGELRPNQAIEFSFGKQEVAPQPTRHIEKEMTSVTKDDQETKQKIEALRKELKALSETVKSLNQDVRKAILDAPVDPGVYHFNFYDQLRIYIQALRLQIEDSRTWLAASAGKNKKQGYWGMTKKHGTTFSLSGERTTATSTG